MADRTDTLTFDIEGMTCATCALRIERVLGKQDGVADATVNLTGKEARVVVDDGVDAAALSAAVGGPERPCCSSICASCARAWATFSRRRRS